MKTIDGIDWYRILCNYRGCEKHGIELYGYCKAHQKYKHLKGNRNKNGVIIR